MLKDFKLGEWKTDYWYELAYDDGAFNGYGFPCDENGNPAPDMNLDARKNLEWCREHPEKFVRAGKVVRHKNTYRENNSGICSCGTRIELWNEYQGACSCEKCGRWYNLFGQELLPPEQWESDDDEAYEEVW